MFMFWKTLGHKGK